MNPANAFFRYMLGFLTFISVSLVLTFAVGFYEANQSIEKQTAAAIQAMLEQK